jgi:single-strand DNA-binding protein
LGDIQHFTTRKGGKNMNKCILMGRLVRQPEVRVTTGITPTTVARFTLAVDRKFHREGEQSADFISCTAFGKTAEFAEKYLKQGTKVVAEGRWQTGSYKNKDGQTVYTNDCLIESLEFAESKKAEGNESQEQSQTNANDFMNLSDSDLDELPFN